MRHRAEHRGWIGPLVLVSSSPRRRRLLEQLRIEFRVYEPNVSEDADAELGADALTRLLAARKLARYLTDSDAGDTEGRARSWALAADTVVELGGAIVGKPADRDEAAEVLGALAGKVHAVVTGLALYNGATGSVCEGSARTEVRFARLSRMEIETYLGTEEWRNAAGGYRIQERGAVLVEGVRGSCSNVVGLPIRTFYGMVMEQGYSLFPETGTIIR